MGERGRLLPEVQVPLPTEVLVTEKVDGTNGRIVVVKTDSVEPYSQFLIGGKEEFLYAQGDLLFTAANGVAETLKPVAHLFPAGNRGITVYFVEVFGGRLPSSKQYTKIGVVTYRIFDIADIDFDILLKTVEEIASWRDHGGQKFRIEEELLKPSLFSLGSLTPRLGKVVLPTSIEETMKAMQAYTESLCNLGGGLGKAEGIVVRTPDRSVIAKLRFEDYDRTLRARK
jgi:hypothetical protein